MSRKAREKDRSGTEWKTPSVYGLVGNYGPFHVKGYEPIDNAIYRRTDDEDAANLYHEMYPMAGPAQEVLLRQNEYDVNEENSPRKKGMIIIDITTMFDNDDEWNIMLEREVDDDDN